MEAAWESCTLLKKPITQPTVHTGLDKFYTHTRNKLHMLANLATTSRLSDTMHKELITLQYVAKQRKPCLLLLTVISQENDKKTSNQHVNRNS